MPLRAPWTDRRAERVLGAVACVVLLVIAGMVVFVFEKAWPSFANNGLGFFSARGDVDLQIQDIINSPAQPSRYVYTIGTWPLIWGTFITTVAAVAIGLVFALLSAVFIVELAPERIRRVLDPVVRLLAAVPSVIYGLIGILVLVPWVGKHLATQGRRESVEFVVQLSGGGVLVATLILTVMITPIMIAIITDALRSVPKAWTEGAAALGVNRWRVMRTVAIRAVRPAIVAAAVLATARALGEAIMLSMVSGGVGFAPNPLDGLTFFLEPVRPLAASIVNNSEGLSVTPLAQTLYAFAALLLISSMFLSFGAWYAKRSLRRFGVNP